jgi:hypothetical protein
MANAIRRTEIGRYRLPGPHYQGMIRPDDGRQFDLIGATLFKGPVAMRVRTYRVHEDEGELRL